MKPGHGDLPDGAALLACSENTPIAAFTVGPRVLAMQPHPEFGTAVAETLYRGRADRIGHDLADDAVASLDRPLDRGRVADWIVEVARS